MDSRERVSRALTGQKTDRIPADYSAHLAVTEALMAKTNSQNSEELMQLLGVDFRRVSAPYGKNQKEPDSEGYFTDFWGIEKRRNPATNQLEEIKLAFTEESTIEEVDAHPWPTEVSFDYITETSFLRQMHDRYYTVGAPWSPFFHEVGWIVGQENFLMWMHTRPDLIERVIEHVTRIELEACRKFFEASRGCLDIAFFGNDFGTQRGLFISPQQFNQFIRPALKKFYDLSHDYNLMVMQHSCGAIAEIIPWLIEDGVNIIDPIQSSCSNMKLEELYAKFGGKVAFHGGVCTQSLLPFGSAEEVRQQVIAYRKLSEANGGYILTGSQEYMDDIPLENILAIYETNKSFSK
jgi:uroporphyrinogen decarboxylase